MNNCRREIAREYGDLNLRFLAGLGGLSRVRLSEIMRWMELRNLSLCVSWSLVFLSEILLDLKEQFENIVHCYYYLLHYYF